MLSKLYRFFLKFKFLWIYIIVNRRLYYSFEALFKGINSYENSDYGKDIELRRNIHMLEKGISFNSRKLFGEKYIVKTVKLFQELLENKKIDKKLEEWAYSVLTEYFTIVEQTDITSKANTIFNKLNNKNIKLNKKPYAPKSNTIIKYDDLYAFAKNRKSIRFYIDKKIEIEKIEKAVSLASYSPSACNRQPFRFIYIEDKKILSSVKNQAGGAQGFDFPGLFVILGNYGGFFEERDFFIPIIDSSIATTNLMNALETLGLSSVAINWPNLPKRDKEIRNILNIKDTEIVVMLMGVGYKADIGLTPYSEKKSLNELLEVV